MFGAYSGFQLGGKLNEIAVPDFTQGYSGELLFNVAREYAFEISANTSSNGPSSSTQVMYRRAIPTQGVAHYSICGGIDLH